MDYDKIGKFIAASRKEKELTQNELAEKLNITDRAVSRWERGKGCPDISLLEDLSKILDVSIIELLKGEKFMYLLLVFLLISIPVANVFSKALLSETNIKTEKLKSKIERQESANESLEMQINELVSMENIQKIAAEFGLSYNSENIVQVEDTK